MFKLFKQRLNQSINKQYFRKKSWTLGQKITLNFIATFLALSVISGVVASNINQLIETNRWVNHTYLIILKLENLGSNLSRAESGQRGYIMTANEQHLELYYQAIASIDHDLNQILQLTQDNSLQQQNVKILKTLIEKRLIALKETLDTRQKEGFLTAQDLIKKDIGRKLSNQIYQLLDVMQEEENRLLILRSQQVQFSTHNTLIVLGAGGVFSLLLLLKASLMINQNMLQQQQIETILQVNTKKLKKSITDLEQLNDKIEQLGELSNVLQACLTLEEAYIVLGALLARLFPETIGGLFITNESKTVVQSVANWGEHPARRDFFEPNQCWALRRGQPYLSFHKDSSLHCGHVVSEFPIQTLCVPMVSQGDAIGILHFIFTETGQLPEPQQLLAKAVTENISTAIANLKLRQSLKEQSIRDSTTGLFNRRYLEESLEQEIQRAERHQQSLGMIMLDVDHFKKFNDSFGHDAGDIVLRELGKFLKSVIRGSDIACRYGGEEFLLLLPETSLEMTQRRAEEICKGTKELVIEHRNQALGMITVSLGVASFPRNGHTVESLVRASDIALYKAKRQGRNQVIVAEET